MTTLERGVATPRLLAAGGDRGVTTFSRHLAVHGSLPPAEARTPAWHEEVLREIDRAGLRGRGGAGFPSFRKMASVRATGARIVLVVNAMEGEPASAKDRVLLHRSPHLVFDGAEVVAGALRAEEIVFCVPDDRNATRALLAAALTERGGPTTSVVRPELVALPGGYVAGEESALVAAVEGRAHVPSFRPDKAVPLALGRRAALVHNVETLAGAALVARHGADWYRSVGPPEAPGTCLVTLSGELEYPGVLEVEIGTPIDQIVGWARPSRPLQATLVGGYGGSWLSHDEMKTPYAPSALAALDASMGAGVLVALGVGSCGLDATARIVRYMAAESAGQCGPCLYGLPAIADDLRLIGDGTGGNEALGRLAARCKQVSGRGACRHPDGVARLVKSALRVFASDVALHAAGYPCGDRLQPTAAFPQCF